MKKLATVFFLLLTAAAFAQNKKIHTPKGKGEVSGFVAAERSYIPTEGVKAFIYSNDSTIIGSGITDSAGMYETNKVEAGTYNVKFVYPSNKNLIITNVPVGGNKATLLNIMASPPTSDTTATYLDIVPKPSPAALNKPHRK